MEQRNKQYEQWLDRATAGIRFGPDRAAVRAELKAHLEDKAADLQRIFPQLSPEEAGSQALADMGDAEELGKELAQVHKPWLGYLWRASKWAAAVLTVAVLVWSFVTYDHYASAGHPLWGAFSTVYGQTKGEKVNLGGYTFQIVGAAYVDYPEDSPYTDGVQVAVRVSTPRFWERINETAIQQALTMVGPGGWAWDMDRGAEQTVWEQGENQVLCGLRRAEWGLFHDTYVAYGDMDWQEGERVELEFDFGKGSFTLEADGLERVVIK